MRRLVPLFACICVLAVPSSSSAAPPERTGPTRFTVDLAFPTICDFPLVAHVEGFTHFTTFVDENGDPIRGFTGGQLFVTWERTDTGFTRRFAIPGPTFFAADGTPIRGTGRWANPDLDGTWYILAGNIVMDENFNTVSSTGRKVPVCELMA